MKRYIYLFFIGLATLVFASCEGPQGPPGLDGMNGTNGVDGADGADGNVTCLTCHGDAMDLISFQFAASAHSAGAIAVDYAGGRARCAPCHSHDQYVEWAETGSVANDISNPTAWKCKTCHNIHTTFEGTDYAFRKADAVTLYDGTVFDEANNNVCATCHQARRGRSSYDASAVKDTVLFDDDDAEVAEYMALITAGHVAWGPAGEDYIFIDNAGADEDSLYMIFNTPATHAFINSTHGGPHHGPQADLWAGVGGSSAGTAFSGHSGGCVECHMGDNSGHTFTPESATCEACHTDGTDKQDDLDAIYDRLEAIAVELDARYIVHIDDAWESGDPLFGAVHPMYASATIAEIDAWFNFMLLMEDRSLGAHNPTYADALLDAAEAALGL